MDVETGQIPGSGFDGDVHDHLSGMNYTHEVSQNAWRGTLSQAEVENCGARYTSEQGGTYQSISNTQVASTFSFPNVTR